MSQNKLRILVISDLHAVISEDEKHDDSHLVFTNGKSEFANITLQYMASVAKDIDMVICAGDISNKANENAFRLGWEYIQNIKSELGAAHLISVPGNHDHKSRLKDQGSITNASEQVLDPKLHLQYIKPNFPFEDHQKNSHFWSWHWCHQYLETEDVNVISLNSSAFHGYNELENQHGRIAPETISSIAEHVASTEFKKSKLNILVLHHHPHKMEHTFKNQDAEVMEGGQKLLYEISAHSKGHWLVVHGHRHFAEITHGSTGHASPPIIFSSGSLSGRIDSEIIDRSSNQFYVIEIDMELTAQKYRLHGTFEAFSRNVNAKWIPSESEYLPANGGFGCNTPEEEIADLLIKELEGGKPYLDPNDLKAFEDHFKYSTPRQIKKVINCLEQEGYQVILEKYKIIQIGKTKS